MHGYMNVEALLKKLLKLKKLIILADQDNQIWHKG